MKFCTDCWNFDRCNAIGRVVDLSVDDGVCRDFDECKPQTNADRIRAMNDEELAEFLGDWAQRHRAWMCDSQGECLALLQEPAKDGEDDG